MSEPEVAYRCDLQSFKPSRIYPVRWLDIERDFGLLKAFHDRRARVELFSRDDARRWRDRGFTDAGAIENGARAQRFGPVATTNGNSPACSRCPTVAAGASQSRYAVS